MFKGGPLGQTAVGRDEIKTRLKKFDSHTMAISKLVRENTDRTSA
jgi:hypothetical protein